MRRRNKKRRKNYGEGRTVKFHGAFGTKAAAMKKERSVDGFIKRVKMRGGIRYVVMTGK